MARSLIHFKGPFDLILMGTSFCVSFRQAFFSEAKCIFGNRLIHDEHRGEFERILDTCCRRLFDVDQTDYYFVPSSQSSHLSYTNEFDWAEQVKRAVTVCCTIAFLAPL